MLVTEQNFFYTFTLLVLIIIFRRINQQIILNFRVPLIRDGLVLCAPEERKLQPLKNINILDVGCGGGILTEV